MLQRMDFMDEPKEKPEDGVSFMIKILKAMKWFFWELMGTRSIWEKIKPPVNPVTKPATIALWVVGIYVAFFGVASQRYENRIDIIENRANAIFTQLGTLNVKKVLSRIPVIKNKDLAFPCKVLF